jgi:hypothetical protein
LRSTQDGGAGGVPLLARIPKELLRGQQHGFAVFCGPGTRLECLRAGTQRVSGPAQGRVNRPTLDRPRESIRSGRFASTTSAMRLARLAPCTSSLGAGVFLDRPSPQVAIVGQSAFQPGPRHRHRVMHLPLVKQPWRQICEVLGDFDAAPIELQQFNLFILPVEEHQRRVDGPGDPSPTQRFSTAAYTTSRC